MQRDFLALPSAEICAQIYAVPEVDFCAHLDPDIYVPAAFSA